ncbi:MAG: threonine synthase, partial [Chloroflexi bacterium]|nr:threonine synthase [Chloroflexota bacterium]
MSEGVLKRYASRLPLTAATPALSIGEGNTPLVRSRNLEREFGVGTLYFKLEGCNPTGSFKDRGMVVAVAKAMEEGMTRLLCASTGNTSASASAFGAAAGLETVVLVPEGSVAPGKMSQAVAYGARIVTIQGNFDDALRIARELASYEERFALVNSVNPNRLEGQKTAAFEIVDDIGDAPDYVFIPVGNAGNITAYWRGFVEYHQAGFSTHRPRMMGMEAAGAAPIVNG